MKRIIYLVAVLLTPLLGLSQTQKFKYTPKVKQRVEITNLLGNITLVNTGGGVISIESDFSADIPDRAKGLQTVGAMEDNTGLGINITEDNGVIYISGATNKVKDYNYSISVPKGMSVSLDYNSPFANGDLSIDSYNGSLEVKTLNANVNISNSTGPLAINTVSGEIEVSFDKISQSEPTSLATVSGQINISLPEKEKATVKVNTMTGKVISDFKPESKKTEKSDKRAKGLISLKMNMPKEFKVNGGGVKVSLNSVSGNINLNKQ
jgi:lia operon protein LiaG